MVFGLFLGSVGETEGDEKIQKLKNPSLWMEQRSYDSMAKELYEFSKKAFGTKEKPINKTESLLPECEGSPKYGSAPRYWTNCFGTRINPGQDKYVGEFKESKWHGSGTLTFPDGATYVGEWKDDNMHGNGTFTWANGDQYFGEFQNGNRHGQGSLTHADGTVKKGIWEKGKLINSN